MSFCENLCGDGGMPSSPNDIKILLLQIKSRLKELETSTEKKLLCHDRKNSRTM